MGIIYERAKEEYYGYYKRTSNSIESLINITPLQKSLIDPNSQMTKEELIKEFKRIVKKLNDGKKEHTFRGVLDISGLFENFQLSPDYKEFAMIAELFHDVARSNQGFETGTHVDDDSYNVDKLHARGVEYEIASLGITNHGSHGEYLLKINCTLENVGLPIEYWEIIYNTVKFHTIDSGRPFPLVAMDETALLDKTTSEALRDKRLKSMLMTLIFQAVKAVDDYDLHNKVLTGEIPIVRRTFGLDVDEGDTLTDFAKIWHISERELREQNGYSENYQVKKGDIIRIDSENIPIECFQIANDFADMYYNDTISDSDFPKLQRRHDYTFFSAEILRLRTLRNIVFRPLLEHIIRTGMLDRTLEMYPPKYRLIMEPFISYAKKETEDRITDAKGSIYVKRTIKGAN